MNLRYSFIILLSAILFTSCKTASITNSKTSLYKNEVFACYYHNKYNGKKTANGEIFSNNKYTAAHKTLAFGSQILVTNLANNKSVQVTINDRGPFGSGFEIDLSKKAFDAISHDKKAGKLSVKLEIINHTK